jgi:uncharacterized protein YukE
MTDSVVDTAFEDAVRTIESAITKLKQAWDEIVDHVNLALRILPGYLEDQLRKSMQRLTAEYRSADVWLLDQLLERGSPSALRQTASDWNTEVGGPASDHAQRLAFAQLPSNGKWSGTAQAAYRSVVDLQTKTLGDLKGLTDETQSTLNDIADALKVYWVGIAVAVASLAAAMVCCGVATGTGVGAPAAVQIAIGAVIAFWAAVVGATVLFDNSLDAITGKLERLTTQNGSEGRWPPATADISDATVSDDDPSDWIPNL